MAALSTVAQKLQLYFSCLWAKVHQFGKKGRPFVIYLSVFHLSLSSEDFALICRGKITQAVYGLHISEKRTSQILCAFSNLLTSEHMAKSGRVSVSDLCMNMLTIDQENARVSQKTQLELRCLWTKVYQLVLTKRR